MIIALHGFAQSGKDTLGEALVDNYNFQRTGFADIIRKAVYILNPILSHDPMGNTTRVQDVVDEHGWEWSKKQYKEVRRLLQIYGTEAGRDLIYPDIWVDAVFNSMEDGVDYVITDLRFKNEVEAVLSHNGVCIKILRPGIGPVNNHASDAGLEDNLFDAIINNDGSIQDLKEEARFVHALAYTKEFGNML